MTVLLLILEPIVASVFWPQFARHAIHPLDLHADCAAALMALVLTLVIIAGEIDLSPASSMALSACVFAAVQAAGVPFPIAMLICVAPGSRARPIQRIPRGLSAAALDHRHHRHADALSRPRAGAGRRRLDQVPRMVHGAQPGHSVRHPGAGPDRAGCRHPARAAARAPRSSAARSTRSAPTRSRRATPASDAHASRPCCSLAWRRQRPRRT